MDNQTQLEYAKMLEIPVNTCNVVVKKSKKKKKRAPEAEALKQQVLDSVNARLAAAPAEVAEEETSSEMPAECVCAEETGEETVALEQAETADFPEEEVVQTEQKGSAFSRFRAKFRGKGAAAEAAENPRRFNVVMAEFVAVVALVAVIFLTNVFMPTSGINTVIRSVFGAKETQTEEDVRDYTQFTAESPYRAGELTVEEGVMTFSGTGTLYAPCDGIISKIVEEAGKKAVEIEHSKKFKTVISGVDYAYYTEGDTVYGSLPVAFVNEGTATVSLYNDGVLVSNYLIDNGNIVWQS